MLAQLDQMKSEWLWPDEMFSDYLEGFYPPSFCYIRGLGKYFLPTLVEDFSQPSAYKCAGNLRKVAYQLLEEFLPGEPQEKSIVNEYFRDGSHLVKVPVLFRPNYISEAKIEYRSDSFRVAECQELFYAALGIAPIQQDDVKYDDRIFLAATIYWVKHAEPKVKGAELAALLINRCRADAK